jgi:hypothetical protein
MSAGRGVLEDGDLLGWHECLVVTQPARKPSDQRERGPWRWVGVEGIRVDGYLRPTGREWRRSLAVAGSGATVVGAEKPIDPNPSTGTCFLRRLSGLDCLLTGGRGANALDSGVRG